MVTMTKYKELNLHKRNNKHIQHVEVNTIANLISEYINNILPENERFAERIFVDLG